MKYDWILAGVGTQALRLRYRSASTSQSTTVSSILTVGDVCRRLRKSRRQVYRYLREGRLNPCAHVLGQWLFAPREVERARRSSTPRWLQRYFWDTRVSSLSHEDHRDYILGRLLEFGDRRALQWVLKAYPRRQVIAFLKGRGADVLSSRTWQFWARYLGLPAKQPTRSWRSRGRAWGGLS